MDFHSLSRRQLQALCKQHKIPANTTNVAMAAALDSLLNKPGSETVVQAMVDMLGATPCKPQAPADGSTITEKVTPSCSTRVTRSQRKKVPETEPSVGRNLFPETAKYGSARKPRKDVQEPTEESNVSSVVRRGRSRLQPKEFVEEDVCSNMSEVTVDDKEEAQSKLQPESEVEVSAKVEQPEFKQHEEPEFKHEGPEVQKVQPEEVSEEPVEVPEIQEEADVQLGLQSEFKAEEQPEEATEAPVHTDVLEVHEAEMESEVVLPAEVQEAEIAPAEAELAPVEEVPVIVLDGLETDDDMEEDGSDGEDETETESEAETEGETEAETETETEVETETHPEKQVEAEDESEGDDMEEGSEDEAQEIHHQVVYDVEDVMEEEAEPTKAEMVPEVKMDTELVPENVAESEAEESDVKKAEVEESETEAKKETEKVSEVSASVVDTLSDAMAHVSLEKKTTIKKVLVEKENASTVAFEKMSLRTLKLMHKKAAMGKAKKKAVPLAPNLEKNNCTA